MSIIPKLPKIRGEYRFDSAVSHLSWFKVGGKAEVLYKPEDEDDLSYFLTKLPLNIPITILGAGSNTLIRDGGVEGVVIKLGKNFQDIELEGDNLLSVGASALNFYIAKFCLQHQITGFEFLIGIPGSIGGGIAMNAGSYGSEFKNIIHSVEAINRSGKKCIFSNDELKLSYRKCGLNDFFIFTKAKFHYKSAPEKIIQARMEEIIELRQKTQPITELTGGSTFQNYPPYKAWELIDQCGLRSYSLGGGAISKLHCNFLINKNNATASDLENLCQVMHKSVLEKFNIDLKLEIKIIGKKLK